MEGKVNLLFVNGIPPDACIYMYVCIHDEKHVKFYPCQSNVGHQPLHLQERENGSMNIPYQANDQT